MKKPIDVKPIKFNKLIALFGKKIFAIPEIQREFVWTKAKIVDFLDSVKKHYPTGSFLICKVPAKKIKHIRESTTLPPFDKHNNRECYIVVDGQQRLSVLYSILYGKKMTNTRRYQNGIDFTEICLTPQKYKDNNFDFYSTKDDHHIKLYDVLNQRLKYDVGKIYKKRINECYKCFKNYTFPFIFITGYDEKSMREAFIRLNKGGTSLSSEDKIFAMAYHKDTDFRRHCSHLLHDLKKGFDNYERIHFIKSIAANLGIHDFVGANSLSAFAKKIRNPRDKLHIDYKEKHRKIFQAIKQSADFLIQRFKHASYIPYPAMLSILSIFFYENNNQLASEKQIKEIERWFWTTGFTKRYSGSNQRYNQLNDAEEMRKLANSKKYIMKLEGKTRIEPISIKELTKIKYNKAGALRNSFFCYLITKTPRNFANGQPIQIEDVSSIFNTKNDHHIFPLNILKKYNINDINSIINICFLTFGENVKIRTAPWSYLKEFKKRRHFRKVMESHIMPHKDCLLKKGKIDEKFKAFKRDRMLIIKRDLIKLIGAKYVMD